MPCIACSIVFQLVAGEWYLPVRYWRRLRQRSRCRYEIFLFISLHYPDVIFGIQTLQTVSFVAVFLFIFSFYPYQ